MSTSTAMVMEWDDRYLVGHQAMDDTHREFVDLVNAMLRAGDGDFAAALDAFARHAEEHFASEQRLMERYGFPPRDCHVDEHERVLASVREVRSLVAAGDVARGPRVRTGVGRLVSRPFRLHGRCPCHVGDEEGRQWRSCAVAPGDAAEITSIAGHVGEPALRIEAAVDTGGTPCQ